MQKIKKFKKKERFSDVDDLIKRITEETPSSGEYLFDYKLEGLAQSIQEMDSEETKKKYKVNFSDLPISSKTVEGLIKRRFFKMTEIQRCVIPHAIAGRDIMAASKTGSGKTLSYLIPIIERLYIEKWTVLDGLGALIILPTRELAIQVFEVFNSITEFHELSVGLVIGGKNLKYEQEHIHTMNVLICTPGRLLQHMEESPGFNTYNLKILILDEADMILEMGFMNTLNAILKNLPDEKQTCLFSATLSKSIHELSRLNLKSPEYIFLHVSKKDISETDNKTEPNKLIADLYETPIKLDQFYMKINLEDKLDTLFSFMKSHQKAKILIFFSTCKQVRFAFESFRKLRIGLPLMELHGRQKQAKRMAIFFTFSEKRFSALFTTNIAARGLDFPSVDWIVQVDCPEDVATYIHRVGRTARYKSGGKSILFLTPEESVFMDKLKEKKLMIKKIETNPQKQLTIKSTLQAYLSESIDLKYLAQRAFISYMRFVYLASDKKVFNVHKIDTTSFAESLGMIQIPVIKFKKKENEDENNENIDETCKKQKLKKLKEKIKVLKQRKRENIDVLSQRFDNLREKKEENNENDDFLVPKKIQENLNNLKKPELITSKRKLKKINIDGGLFDGRNKIKFDEEGNKLTQEDIRMNEYKENLNKIEKEKPDFTVDYSRKLLSNKEEDDIKEQLRRKEKRKKRKLKEAMKEMGRKGINPFKNEAVLDNEDDE